MPSVTSHRGAMIAETRYPPEVALPARLLHDPKSRRVRG